MFHESCRFLDKMKLFVFALFVAAAAAAPIDDSNGPVELIVHGVPDGHTLELGEIVNIEVKEHSDGEVIATNLLHPLTAVGIAEAAAAAIAEASEPEVSLPESVVLPAPVAPEVVFPEAVVLPAPAQPEVVIPEAVVLPAPAQPEVVVPVPVVLPSPVQPEVAGPEAGTFPGPAVPDFIFPEAVVLPSPPQPEVVVPEAVVLPSPAQPEVVLPESAVPELQIPEAIPAPAAQLDSYLVGEVYKDDNVQVNVNAPKEPGMISTIQSWFSMVLNYISDGTVQNTHQII